MMMMLSAAREPSDDTCRKCHYVYDCQTVTVSDSRARTCGFVTAATRKNEERSNGGVRTETTDGLQQVDLEDQGRQEPGTRLAELIAEEEMTDVAACNLAQCTRDRGAHNPWGLGQRKRFFAEEKKV